MLYPHYVKWWEGLHWWPVCVSMMTSSNGNIFRVTGPMCGEFTGPGEFPAQWPVTRSFDVFFDLRLNKRLSKQPWGWWFETPAWSLWRHRNAERHLRGSFYQQGLSLIPTWIKSVMKLIFHSQTSTGEARVSYFVQYVLVDTHKGPVAGKRFPCRKGIMIVVNRSRVASGSNPLCAEFRLILYFHFM